MTVARLFLHPSLAPASFSPLTCIISSSYPTSAPCLPSPNSKHTCWFHRFPFSASCNSCWLDFFHMPKPVFNPLLLTINPTDRISYSGDSMASCWRSSFLIYCGALGLRKFVAERDTLRKFVAERDTSEEGSHLENGVTPYSQLEKERRGRWGGVVKAGDRSSQKTVDVGGEGSKGEDETATSCHRYQSCWETQIPTNHAGRLSRNLRTMALLPVARRGSPNWRKRGTGDGEGSSRPAVGLLRKRSTLEGNGQRWPLVQIGRCPRCLPQQVHQPFVFSRCFSESPISTAVRWPEEEVPIGEREAREMGRGRRGRWVSSGNGGNGRRWKGTVNVGHSYRFDDALAACRSRSTSPSSSSAAASASPQSLPPSAHIFPPDVLLPSSAQPTIMPLLLCFFSGLTLFPSLSLFRPSHLLSPLPSSSSASGIPLLPHSFSPFSPNEEISFLTNTNKQVLEKRKHISHSSFLKIYF